MKRATTCRDTCAEPQEYDEPAQHISIILKGAQYRREPNLYLSILDNPIKSQLPIYKNSHFI